MTTQQETPKKKINWIRLIIEVLTTLAAYIAGDQIGI